MPSFDENKAILELAIRIAETKPTSVGQSIPEAADDIIKAAEKLKKFLKTPV
jgi:hypothetical protein